MAETLLTPSDRMERRLAQLLALLDPPYTAGWKDYAIRAAEDHAAEENGELAELPERLKAEMQARGYL